ncbi:MAG: hypothetical protein AAGD09_03190 [Cyanobacteria bacterium P01_F01_bin.56]
MKIDYSQVDYPSHACKISRNGRVHVLEKDIGNQGDCIRYSLQNEAPAMQKNKTKYWTNTSGSTTATTYLGCISVEIVNIPEWELENA